MQIVKEYVRENKKFLICMLVIVVVLGIVSIYINNQKNRKIYLSDDYIFTKDSYEHNDYYVSELPYINIKGLEKTNNKLLNQYYEIIEFKDKMMKYDYYINKNIISLIVKTYYIDSPDSYPNILIYNINIDTGELLENNELLNVYNLSNDDVKEVVRNDIKEYYNYEIRNNYVSNDCNFDCYLSNVNALPIDDYQLYIKDGILYAYKFLNLSKDLYYDANAGFNLFNFRIAKK